MALGLSQVATLSCGRARSLLTGAAMAALALALALARLATYDEPLERDITAFAVIGRELIEGRALYSDVWDHKPPAGVVTHALAVAALGFGRGTIYVLNVVTAITILLAVYAAGRVSGGRSAGLWAAAFWTVISGDLYVQGNQPNVELFINAAMTWAFVLLVQRPWPAAGQVGRSFAIGTLFAVASLYKTVAVAPAILLTVAGVVWPPEGLRPCRRPAYIAAAIIASVGAAAWFCVSLYFALTGRLRDFTDAVFAYNRFYAGDLAQNFVRALAPNAALYSPLQSAAPLACLAAVGMILGAWVGDRRRWLLLGAWATGTAIAVALPGRFFPHYYQLWLPVLAVAGGWAVAELSGAALRRAPSLGHLLAGTTLALLVILQAPFYELAPDDWSRVKYRTDLFVGERTMARCLPALLRDHETFYEFGAEPGLYFETERRPLSGIVYAYPLLGGPLKDSLSTRLIRDLEKTPPDLFIVSTWALLATGGHHPVLDWLRPRYRMAPYDPTVGHFLLFYRRGSSVESRLLEAETVGVPGSRRDAAPHVTVTSRCHPSPNGHRADQP